MSDTEKKKAEDAPKAKVSATKSKASTKKQPVKTQQHVSTTHRFDTVVIGSGPGGEGAAMQLTKGGHKVAMIESYHAVGGGCTHWGTIPSKAMRHSVSRLIELQNNPLYTSDAIKSTPGFSTILKHTEGVIRQQVMLRKGFYDRNGVQIFQGIGSFVDKNTVQVVHGDGTIENISANQFLLAVGSRPYRPKDVDFEHPRVFDSDTILSLDYDPKSMIIYGAGVIGCEYASIFRGLGARVELINTRGHLLQFLDQEMSDALSYHFWNNAINIRNNESYERIEPVDDGVIVHMESGKKMKGDCLLFANGRTGNSDLLNLDAIGLEADSRGQLRVNNFYQTAVDNVYAVGDVVGYPSLASAAYDQGRLAAEAILTANTSRNLVDHIPSGIYTIPEISSVGKTEQELTAEKVPYEVGRAQFKHLARAQIGGTRVGGLKILFHRDTKQLLGIHCFGERAAEIVHIGQAIMEQKGEGNTIEYFIHTTFNYPTMAEAYRVAALNGLNKLF